MQVEVAQVGGLAIPVAIVLNASPMQSFENSNTCVSGSPPHNFKLQTPMQDEVRKVGGLAILVAMLESLSRPQVRSI